MTIGERIKAAREEKSMTQTQLADKLNISYVNISQLETGARDPKAGTLAKIAAALEVDIRYLLQVNVADDDLNKLTKGNVPIAETENEIEFHIAGPFDEQEYREVVRKRAIEKYNRLNYDGQKKAYDYINDLSKIPEYKKEGDNNDGQ